MRTGRERIEAAFGAGGTREVAAVVCYEGIFVRDHWEGVTDEPWWALFSPDIERQVAWRRDLLERTGLDWFVLPSCAAREARRHQGIEVRSEGVFHVDARTGRAERLERPAVSGWSPGGKLHSVRVERLPESAAEVDEQIPVPRAVGRAEPAVDGRGDLAGALLAELGGSHFPIRSVASPIWACYGLWGFEGMMTMVATRPDLVEHACRRSLVRARAAVREAAALGAAGMWIEECLTDMVSPEAFARLNLPFLRELVEAIRAEGMRSIYYFCGDPAGKWDLLLDAGADALSLEESKKGFAIDVDEVVARVAGRCAVLGNLDAIGLLEHGSEDELRAGIARQLAAGRRNGGRFVMSIGSPVTPGTSVERVRRYCELVHEMGRSDA